MRRWRSSAPLTALLLGGACSLATAPPMDEVLTSESRDERCARLVDEWRAAPDDPQRALAASRALFEAVDVTVQQALVDTTRDATFADPRDVVAAEAPMPATIRDRVLALTETGTQAAQAAIDGFAALPTPPPEAVDAQVHLALHLIFVAWANGPMRAMMSGLPKRIEAAMALALAGDRTFDHGAPLRLRGRWLAQAPWPIGDVEQALTLLQEAVHTAPLPIHHLFLGDLLLKREEPDAAAAEWRAVLTDAPDATTAAVCPFHREMAQRRLDAMTTDDPRH
ncbi:MAG: hypothetical protein H6835_16790 [Planctomycetes bacterium]|nr:hypothetical protein [Planctomycetota bacterium]